MNHKITFTELEILRRAYVQTLQDREITGVQLGKDLDITLSWVYEVLDKMVEKGLIQRETINSRKVMYSLTPKGEEIAERWLDLFNVLKEFFKEKPMEKWRII